MKFKVVCRFNSNSTSIYVTLVTQLYTSIHLRMLTKPKKINGFLIRSEIVSLYTLLNSVIVRNDEKRLDIAEFLGGRFLGTGFAIHIVGGLYEKNLRVCAIAVFREWVNDINNTEPRLCRSGFYSIDP